MASERTTTEVVTSDTDSIEISRSTKGVYTYSAKIYYEEGKKEDAQERLEGIDAWFHETFAQPNDGPRKLSDLKKG